MQISIATLLMCRAAVQISIATLLICTAAVHIRIESDWARSAGQITRRVGLIYPASGQIDTP